MTEARCPFCFPDANRISHAGGRILGRSRLLVPRRHVSSWFEATPDERSELVAATDIARHAIFSRTVSISASMC